MTFVANASRVGISSSTGAELRVIVADDHALMRSGIMHALAQAPDIKVIAEAEDGLGALASLERELPDVLLLDFHMPRMDGLACLQRVSAQWPELPVLMLSVEDDPTIARQALARGAAGYVLKTIHPTDLASMVRTAARKQVLFGGALDESCSAVKSVQRAATSGCAPGGPNQNGTRPRPEPDTETNPRYPGRSQQPETSEHDRALARSPLDDLSEREQEIVALLCEGRTNKQIASALFVSTKTVKFHLTNIFAKLGVGNRTEACVLALKARGEGAV